MGEARVRKDREEFVHKALSDYFDILMEEQGMELKDKSDRAFSILMFEDDLESKYRYLGACIAPCIPMQADRLDVLIDWPLAPALAQIIAQQIEGTVSAAVQNMVQFRQAVKTVGGPAEMRRLLGEAPEGSDLDQIIKDRLMEIANDSLPTENG